METVSFVVFSVQACVSHDPTKANQEIIRASLLVKQIERELGNLDKLKQRLKKSDHPAFEKMVNGSVRKASKMLQDFYSKIHMLVDFISYLKLLVN